MCLYVNQNKSSPIVIHVRFLRAASGEKLTYTDFHGVHGVWRSPNVICIVYTRSTHPVVVVQLSPTTLPCHVTSI